MDHVNGILANLRQWWFHYCADGVVTRDELRELSLKVHQERVPWAEFLAYVRNDVMAFLERALTYAASLGNLDRAKAAEVVHALDTMLLVGPDADAIRVRADYLVQLRDIMSGTLPRIVTPGFRGEVGEACHLYVRAAFHKTGPKTTVINGALMATSRSIKFLSAEGGWPIVPRNVEIVERHHGGVYLGLTVKKGNGFYRVDDPTWVAAVIDTLVRIAKRHILAGAAGGASRAIPRHVMDEVFQRDRGRCRECGASHVLEFDHIIPFSLGGASSVDNLQILCRPCNLKKGARL